MLNQPIRSFIPILAITIWASIQFANGLSAQETSSRRPTPKLEPWSVTTSITDPEAKAVAVQLSEGPQANAPSANEFSGSTNQQPLPQVSNRRKLAARTTPILPILPILPVTYVADQVPVPSLEDPEQFRVSSDQPNLQHLSDKLPRWEPQIDKFPQPTGPYSSLPVRKRGNFHSVAGPSIGNFVLPQQRTQDSIANENTLLDQLPISSLHQGITNNALSQAIVQHTVGDPYLASRSYSNDQQRPTAITKTWRSPNMKHRPLYFEEPNLERYGHTHPRLQPLLSGAHFFKSVALLPYKTGVTPATTCKYSIGHDRPGDCVPTIREQHPFNPRAALRQAVVTVGGIAGL